MLNSRGRVKIIQTSILLIAHKISQVKLKVKEIDQELENDILHISVTQIALKI